MIRNYLEFYTEPMVVLSRCDALKSVYSKWFVIGRS